MLQLAHLALVVHHRAPASVQYRRASRVVLDAPAKLLSLRRSRSSRREDLSHGTRRPPSRGAPPPRRRQQEVAWSIRARPGLLRRCTGASATGPARGPWGTRWRCPASAEALAESINDVGFRGPNRLGAARASVGRARRLVAARRTARSAACVRNAARGALPSDRCDLRAGIITQLTAMGPVTPRIQ